MTIAIKPTASGSTIEQNGSTILTVDGSGNITPSNDLYPKVPAFSAYLSGGNQTLTASTWTKVAFNSEDFDTSSDFDNATNYRYTPSVEGYYQINTNVRFNYSGSAGNATLVAIRKNGSHSGIEYYMTNVSGNWGTRAVSGMLYLNGSTDYIEVYVWTDHGSPFLQDTNSVNRFSAHLVSV